MRAHQPGNPQELTAPRPRAWGTAQVAASRSGRADPPVGPEELDITLDGPLAVPTGETVTHGLLLHNKGDRPVVVMTDGDI